MLDELVYLYFHKPQNKKDIDAYQSGKLTGPLFPCIGIGHNDEGLNTFLNHAARVRGEADGTETDDVSGFDFSITQRMWQLDAAGRSDCYIRGQPTDENYAEKCEWFEECCIKIGFLSGSHVVMIGVFLYEVQYPGVMPSAHPSTGGSNTRMRLITLFIVHPFPAAATGDDALKRAQLTKLAFEGLIAQGLDLRDVSYREDKTINFNSLNISRIGSQVTTEFLNFEKLVVNLLYTHGEYVEAPPGEDNPGLSALQSGFFCVRNEPEKTRQLLHIGRELGYPNCCAVEGGLDLSDE